MKHFLNNCGTEISDEEFKKNDGLCDGCKSLADEKEEAKIVMLISGIGRLEL